MIRKKITRSIEASVDNLSRGTNTYHHTSWTKTKHTLHVYDLPKQMSVVHDKKSLWAQFFSQEHAKNMTLEKHLGKIARIKYYETKKIPKGIFDIDPEVEGKRIEGVMNKGLVKELSLLKLARIAVSLKQASRVTRSKRE